MERGRVRGGGLACGARGGGERDSARTLAQGGRVLLRITAVVGGQAQGWVRARARGRDYLPFLSRSRAVARRTRAFTARASLPSSGTYDICEKFISFGGRIFSRQPVLLSRDWIRIAPASRFNRALTLRPFVWIFVQWLAAYSLLFGPFSISASS
jgi:hypothetical protein